MIEAVPVLPHPAGGLGKFGSSLPCGLPHGLRIPVCCPPRSPASDAKLLQRIAKALADGHTATAQTTRRMLGMLADRVGHAE